MRRLRSIVLVLLTVVISSRAFELNIFAADRDDRRSLDVCVRRLQTGGQDDAAAVLEHLRPMLARRGGLIGWGGVAPGSDDEFKLVCRQLSRSGVSKDRSELVGNIAVGTLRWLWDILVRVLNVIVPGLGTALPIILALYLYIRYKDRVVRALYSDAEKLPPGQRKEIFTSDIVRRDYNRRFNRGRGKGPKHA